MAGPSLSLRRNANANANKNNTYNGSKSISNSRPTILRSSTNTAATGGGGGSLKRIHLIWLGLSTVVCLFYWMATSSLELDTTENGYDDMARQNNPLAEMDFEAPKMKFQRREQQQQQVNSQSSVGVNEDRQIIPDKNKKSEDEDRQIIPDNNNKKKRDEDKDRQIIPDNNKKTEKDHSSSNLQQQQQQQVDADTTTARQQKEEEEGESENNDKDTDQIDEEDNNENPNEKDGIDEKQKSKDEGENDGADEQQKSKEEEAENSEVRKGAASKKENNKVPDKTREEDGDTDETADKDENTEQDTTEDTNEEGDTDETADKDDNTKEDTTEDTNEEGEEGESTADESGTGNSTWNVKIPNQEDLVKLQKCFPSNSESWLKGPRHGNANDPLLDDDFVANMIFFGHHQSNDKGNHVLPDVALNQSICHPDSRFLNATDPLSDDRSIQLWIVRLTYLAMHKVQHQFAIPEALQRIPSSKKDKECNQLAQEYSIGMFDYECPDGKFLVVPIENLGLGAVMRTTAVSGLLAALATNRTVLFVNHAPVGPKVIKHDWYHASCDRFDVQCFYHAPTPCVVTYQELGEALVMGEFRNVTKLYKNPTKMVAEEWFDQERTIILPIKTVTRRVPKNIPGLLRDFTLDFMRNLPTQDDPRKDVLQQVADRFVSKVHQEKVEQLISYGLVMYSMRPHLQSQLKLRDLMQEIVPPNKFHPEATLGLPIRASDKCVEESECLTFEQYMRVLTQIWNRHEANLTQAMKEASVDKLSIVLTTESDSVIQEKDEFMKNRSLVSKVPFKFDFIINDHDIRQDNGNPQNNIPEHNMDVELEANNADEIMLSMVSSLQTQLLARYSIGNCCSNFHRILFEFLDGGCGAAYQSGPECLQKNEDPEFRICCVWDNSEECKAKKVQENIEERWKAVKKKRKQERMRRRQQNLKSMVKGR